MISLYPSAPFAGFRCSGWVGANVARGASATLAVDRARAGTTKVVRAGVVLVEHRPGVAGVDQYLDSARHGLWSEVELQPKTGTAVGSSTASELPVRGAAA